MNAANQPAASATSARTPHRAFHVACSGIVSMTMTTPTNPVANPAAPAIPRTLSDFLIRLLILP
jgi:hypothetical protein